MKEDHYQFTVIGVLCALTILCLVGIAHLVILENVTKDNSFGVDGIIEALKIIAGGLTGGLVAMTRSTTKPSTGAPPAPPQGAAP